MFLRGLELVCVSLERGRKPTAENHNFLLQVKPLTTSHNHMRFSLAFFKIPDGGESLSTCPNRSLHVCIAK